MTSLASTQNNRRGLLVDDYLHLLGAQDIYAIGDVSLPYQPPLFRAQCHILVHGYLLCPHCTGCFTAGNLSGPSPRSTS